MDPIPQASFPPPLQPPPPPLTSSVAPTATTFVVPTLAEAAAAAAAAAAHNHIAHAANATPNIVPPPLINQNQNQNQNQNHNHNHPPYAEMIYAAITALKERNGSSRRAIAKYIDRVYSDLPPTHSALLTHHLKRLKNSGLLVMVKKSYKLPRSDAASSLPTLPLSGPPKLQGQSRGRGRPPKPKLNNINNPQPIPQPNAQPVLVALGLVDEPNAQPLSYKRGPGRPRKSGPLGQDGPSVKKSRGRPPGPPRGLVGVKNKARMVKKTPGRPPKPKSVTGVLGPNGLKRGRGRPPKVQLKTMVIPFAQNTSNVVAPPPPPPLAPPQAVAPNANVAVPPAARPRGRPKKDAAAPGAVLGSTYGVGVGIGAPGTGVLPANKRRGRPAKLEIRVAGKPRKPNNRTGRPVGRPKKNAALAVFGTSDTQRFAYEDLKRKLEYVQSKVKEAVGVLKPQITNESAISAVAAIQELEGLATMDVTAPLQIETQQLQLPQLPQQLPQLPQQLPQLPQQLPQPHLPQQLPQPHLPQPLPQPQLPLLHN